MIYGFLHCTCVQIVQSYLVESEENICLRQHLSSLRKLLVICQHQELNKGKKYRYSGQCVRTTDRYAPGRSAGSDPVLGSAGQAQGPPSMT